MDEKAAYTICQLTTDATVQQWAGGQIQQWQSIDDIVAGIQQRDAAVSGGQIEYDMFGNAIFNNADLTTSPAMSTPARQKSPRRSSSQK